MSSLLLSLGYYLRQQNANAQDKEMVAEIDSKQEELTQPLLL